MSTYFSIGEMSRLHNISIQTLRHYDKIGLLEPAFIKEDSGYRYYSIEQFIKIDLIKHYKTIGISLEEIKEIMSKDMTKEVILSIIDKQKRIVHSKIEQLNLIRNHINFIEKRVHSTDDVEIVAKLENERTLIKYDCISNNQDELEVNIRRALLDAEANYGLLNLELTFTTCYKAIKSGGKVVYKNIMLYTRESPCVYESKIEKLQKGFYLTMNYDDSYINNFKYYKKFIDYINENNINVCGDIYEFSIMPRVGVDGKEKTLTQLHIRLNS